MTTDHVNSLVHEDTAESNTDAESQPDDSAHQQHLLNDEKIKEQRQKQIFRWVMFVAFFLLLLIQHFLLCIFMLVAILQNFINNIQPLLAVIIPATLGETYLIMREMVHFVFTSGDFSLRASRKDDDMTGGPE